MHKTEDQNDLIICKQPCSQTLAFHPYTPLLSPVACIWLNHSVFEVSPSLIKTTELVNSGDEAALMMIAFYFAE